MKFDNIPVAIKQLGENIADSSIRKDIKFNYLQTLKTVKEYCDYIIDKYGSKL